MKRVIITGGSGFLGSNLVRAFRRERIRTISVDVKVPVFERPDEFILADVRDRAKIDRAIELWKPDYVIHLAAISTIQGGLLNPNDTWQTNVEGTRSVMEAVADSPCRPKVIFCSTDKAYGIIHGTAKYTEDLPLRPLKDSPYDVSKAEADSLVRSYKSRGVNAVVLRLCNIYGDYDTNDTRIVPANIRLMLSGKPGRLNKYHDASGEHNFYREMLHASDLCKAVISCINVMDTDAGAGMLSGQAFNIGAPECCSMEAVLTEIAEYLGCSLSPEVHSVTLGRELAVQALDISKAKLCFSYSPSVRISEGIERTVKWWRENYE